MTDEAEARDQAPDIRRRRLILYAAASVGLAAVIVVGVLTLAGGTEKPAAKPKLKAPVIVERIPLRPVNNSGARGLGELVRREKGDGFRVLAVQLKPSGDDEAYQLVLTGGSPEKLLGTEIVGDDGAFVGESPVSADELHSFKRVELRKVTRSPESATTVLRGSIPK